MRIDTHHHHKKAGQNLAFVFFMNLAFNIIVIAGGLATNSMAILADCIHDMSDTLSIGIAWLLEKISQKIHQTTILTVIKDFQFLVLLSLPFL